jgi:hypothetical protein
MSVKVAASVCMSARADFSLEPTYPGDPFWARAALPSFFNLLDEILEYKGMEGQEDIPVELPR